MWWLYTLALCLILSTVAYYFCTVTLSQWADVNVPYIKPIPLFGNFIKVALSMLHPVEFYSQIYYQFAGHKYVGLYQMRTSYLMIRDPQLINQILKKDSSFFLDRGIYSDFSVNPFSNHLFFMNNPQWKIMRNKLSPAFTSNKLKLMYDQINECSDELIKKIHRNVNNNNNLIEVKELMSKYSMNIIGTCIFALKFNAVDDDNSDFSKYGKMIFTPSLRILLKELISLISPTLLRILKIKDFSPDAVYYLQSVFNESIMYRKKNNIVRNDFMQTLMQAENDLVLNPKIPENEKFKETQIVATAILMFSAGFETVSTAIALCLYELSLKKHVQNRVYDEIKLKILKHNGVVSNDFLTELNYLDMVIAEVLRLYPTLFALFRQSTKTYDIPNDSLTIKKGQHIIIPIHALHRDPKYFPNPNEFDPERFSPENKVKIPNGVYIPFGDGPRMCLAKRFAEIEMKLALVEILTKFEVSPCGKTKIPITFSKKAILMIPEGGVWLSFIKRTS